MGLKEYIAQKKKEKSAPKYNIHRIRYVYTKDGEFVAPFVFNVEKTKVKDIESEKIVDLKNGEYSYDNAIQALSELFSVDINKIQHLDLLDMVYHYTYGARIPGKVFKNVRAEIFDNPRNRDTVIQYGSIHKIVASFHDIEPLTQQLRENFATQYKANINRESVLNSVEENIKF